LREEVIIHVAQIGTLPPEEEKGEKNLRRCRPTLHRQAHSRRRGGIREEGSVHVAQTGLLSIGKGLRKEMTIHVAQMGTLSLKGPGEERVGGGE
jgi:hypothetical protein